MKPLSAPLYSLSDITIRAWDVTFEGINVNAQTRRIYATVKQLKGAAAEAGRAVARIIGQSPACLSVTVREA